MTDMLEEHRLLRRTILSAFALVLAALSACDEHDDDDDCHRHVLDSDEVVFLHCHDDDDFDDDNNDDDFDDDDEHNFLLGGGGAEVAVLVTDHPLDGVRKLYVTIREVTLLGNANEPVTLYDDLPGRRVDLLSLRGEDSTRLFDVVSGREGDASAVTVDLLVLERSIVTTP
jgi:hypothetical protein